MEKSNEIKQKIAKNVEEDCKSLKSWTKDWFLRHVIEPKQINIAMDVDGKKYKKVWLITDHINEKDSSYRIVFDSDTNDFGLECTLESGLSWYMGAYGSLEATISSM